MNPPSSTVLKRAPDNPAKRLVFFEEEVQEGMKGAVEGMNRAAIAMFHIREEKLYLLHRSAEDPATPIYPDFESYIQKRGGTLRIARATTFKHQKTLRMWRWLGRPEEEILEIGDGVATAHHIKAVATKIDRSTGEILDLVPAAARLPGETIKEKVNRAIDGWLDTQRAKIKDGEPPPKKEVISYFLHDVAGRPEIKPLKRRLPGGLVDWGWLYNGHMGWFSTDVPPVPVLEFYLKRVRAVDYDG